MRETARQAAVTWHREQHSDIVGISPRSESGQRKDKVSCGCYPTHQAMKHGLLARKLSGAEGAMHIHSETPVPGNTHQHKPRDI